MVILIKNLYLYNFFGFEAEANSLLLCGEVWQKGGSKRRAVDLKFLVM